MKDIGSNIGFCADDTSLYIVEDPALTAVLLNSDLEKVASLGSKKKKKKKKKKWLVSFNTFKLSSF